MAITHGYCTLAELKAAMGITLTASDSALEAIVEDASRHIDDETERQFYVSSSETRYFTADPYDGDLAIDDAVTITAIAFDLGGLRAYDTTLAATDYRLRRLTSVPFISPYYGIALDTAHGRYGWPAYAEGVAVTGTWGASATAPGPIRRACILYAIRLFKRPSAPFGILENSMGGPPLKVGEDADIAALLAPYKRASWVFV